MPRPLRPPSRVAVVLAARARPRDFSVRLLLSHDSPARWKHVEFPLATRSTAMRVSVISAVCVAFTAISLGAAAQPAPAPAAAPAPAGQPRAGGGDSGYSGGTG